MCIHNPAIVCAACPPRQAGDSDLFDAYLTAIDQAARVRIARELRQRGYLS